MSRHSHVHDDELVEEIEQRRHEQRRRGGCGCTSCLLTLVALTALAIGAVFSSLGWIEKHVPEQFKPLVQAMRSQTKPPVASGEALTGETPSPDMKVRVSDWLSDLREQTAAIQKNLDELQKSGALEEQLKILRDGLAKNEAAAQKFTKQETQALTKMLDDMIAGAKKKTETLRSVDFDQLKSQIDTLSKLLPKKTAEQTSEAEKTGGEKPAETPAKNEAATD